MVLINGFTHPTNEFDMPYRLINWHACNSCWDDPRLKFQQDDIVWCPRVKGTDRQFEYSRLITLEQVTSTVRRTQTFHATSAERPS